jgi:hypothetical protein
MEEDDMVESSHCLVQMGAAYKGAPSLAFG